MSEARDFSTFKAAILAALAADPAKRTVYTDTTNGSVGSILLDCIALVGDYLSNATDFRAAELYRQYARLPESMRRLARTFGYPMRGPVSAVASSTITFTSAPYAVDITIPAISVTAAGLTWYYAGGGVLHAGDTTLDVLLTQGTLQTQTSVGTGEDWQTITLASTKVAANSVVVSVAGATWSSVAIIGLAAVDGLEYEVGLNELGQTVVRFGNSYSGKIPALAETIIIQWIDTEGPTGSVGADAFVGTQLSWYDSTLHATVLASITANDASSGADAEETVDAVRDALIPWFRSHNTGVTADAIAAQVLAFSHPIYGAVAKAYAVVGEADTLTNVVRVYVAAADNTGGLVDASDNYKAALLESLNETKIISVEYSIEDCATRAINYALTVKPVLGADKAALAIQIEEALEGVYSLANLEPNKTFYLDDVYAALRPLALVSWLTVDGGQNEVPSVAGEILTLGTVTITWATT